MATYNSFIQITTDPTPRVLTLHRVSDGNVYRPSTDTFEVWGTSSRVLADYSIPCTFTGEAHVADMPEPLQPDDVDYAVTFWKAGAVDEARLARWVNGVVVPSGSRMFQHHSEVAASRTEPDYPKGIFGF